MYGCSTYCIGIKGSHFINDTHNHHKVFSIFIMLCNLFVLKIKNIWEVPNIKQNIVLINHPLESKYLPGFRSLCRVSYVLGIGLKVSIDDQPMPCLSVYVIIL